MYKISEIKTPCADTIRSLDYFIHLLCRKTRELVCVKCLESYLNTNDFPRQYYKQLRKQKLPLTCRNLRRLTKSYIENNNETHEKLQSSIKGVIPILDNLNLFCRIKFFNFVRTLRERTRIQTEEGNEEIDMSK